MEDAIKMDLKKKWDRRTWIGLMWLTIGTVGGLW